MKWKTQQYTNLLEHQETVISAKECDNYLEQAVTPSLVIMMILVTWTYTLRKSTCKIQHQYSKPTIQSKNRSTKNLKIFH